MKSDFGGGGIVHGMPMDDYQNLQALSASGIWAITDMHEGCPLKFWLSSPWNPDREPYNAAHFDTGKALHLAVLEPAEVEKQVVVHGHDRYNSKEAKAVRDNAYASGRIPLKPAEWAIVEAMHRAIFNDPIARGAFDGAGEAEVTALWTDRDYNVPCKARADRVLDGGRILVDLKSARSAHRIGFSRAMWEFGYFSRAAWYIDGWEMTTGVRVEEYWFVVVESKEPYLTAVHKLPESDLEWGRIINRDAVATFSQCLARGEWPGYRPPGSTRARAFITGLPTWAVYQLHAAMEDGAFPTNKISKADIKRGAQLYAPNMDEEI